MKAILEFKVDMTYRVAIPSGVIDFLDSVTDTVDAVLNGFEEAKSLVFNTVVAIQRYLGQLRGKLNQFLDALPQKIVTFLTKTFPLFARNASTVVGHVAGLLRDSKGLSNLLLGSGLDKLVTGLDNALGAVRQVSTPPPVGMVPLIRAPKMEPPLMEHAYMTHDTPPWLYRCSRWPSTRALAWPCDLASVVHNRSSTIRSCSSAGW